MRSDKTMLFDVVCVMFVYILKRSTPARRMLYAVLRVAPARLLLIFFVITISWQRVRALRASALLSARY